MNEHSRGGTPNCFRTVGVEEELLLVDAGTGAPRSMASRVLQIARSRGQTEPDEGSTGGSVGPELQEQQVETDTPAEEDLRLLEIEIGSWREKTRAAAMETGTLVLASGTTPLPVQPETFDDERYAEIARRFGLTASEQLTCGCHVHVSVESDDEAVGALDRIRPWLPVLLALSANSPFWQGSDSGYESFRSQVMTRWPTNGPTEVFGSAEAYARHLDLLTGTQVPLDAGMAYFDARPSHHHPTLEVRVADTCLDPRDAVLVAALSRALVSTGAQQWHRGTEPDPTSVALLRLAMWQAGRRGLSGDLLDPVTHRPRAAREVVDALVAHVAPALETTGDLPLVEEGLQRVFTEGTGAAKQRAILDEEGRLDRAVLRLTELT